MEDLGKDYLFLALITSNPLLCEKNFNFWYNSSQFKILGVNSFFAEFLFPKSTKTRCTFTNPEHSFPHQKSAMIISKSNLNWKKYLVAVLFPGGIKESEGETAHYVSGNFLPKQRVPLLHVRHR